MNASSSEAPTPLLFDWELPRSRKLTMTGFVAGSALLHALCFYLFQVVYPASVALLPPPARLTLIAPDSEENRSLLRWIDAEDPALASATLRPPESRSRALPKVQHVPSYVAEEPKLKPIPPLNFDTRAPSSQPPGPVPAVRRQAESVSVPNPTQVLFSEELTAWGNPNPPASHFSASTSEAPQSLRLRIAVNPRGEIRYCFPINSSGDPALDEQARQHLVTSRFPAAKTASAADGLTWGIATFEWGNEITLPKPDSAASPSP